jgi:hypothetical protein
VDGPVVRRLAILFFHWRPRPTFRIRFENFRRRRDRALREIAFPTFPSGVEGPEENWDQMKTPLGRAC